MEFFGKTMYYTLTVEIQLQNTTKTRYGLQEDEILRTRNVVGIAVRRQDSNGDRKTVTGNALVADDVLGVSFLSLQSDNVNFLDRQPMDYLAVNPDSQNLQFRFIPLDLPNGFNPTKSFIEISDATNLVANTAFELMFVYKEN